VALIRGDSWLQLAWAAAAGVLLVLGAWALARELAPDDDPAAFVSMALGFLVLPLVVPASLLLLFVTMFLVRIVNRSTGLPARLTDSIVVTLLVLVVMYVTGNPFFGVVAALAFAADAVMRAPLPRQWIFAIVCLAGAGASAVLLDVEIPAPSYTISIVTLLLAIGVAYLVTMWLTRNLRSCGDVIGERLSSQRVRAGMLLALLAATQALVVDESGLAHAAITWATLAGVSLTALASRLWRKTVA
jgi:hypothetical protein